MIDLDEPSGWVTICLTPPPQGKEVVLEQLKLQKKKQQIQKKKVQSTLFPAKLKEEHELTLEEVIPTNRYTIAEFIMLFDPYTFQNSILRESFLLSFRLSSSISYVHDNSQLLNQLLHTFSLWIVYLLCFRGSLCCRCRCCCRVTPGFVCSIFMSCCIWWPMV